MLIYEGPSFITDSFEVAMRFKDDANAPVVVHISSEALQDEFGAAGREDLAAVAVENAFIIGEAAAAKYTGSSPVKLRTEDF